MASPATATAIGNGRAAAVTEAAKAEWWLRFNNGAPAEDDGDATDSGDEAEEEDGEGAGGRAATAVSGGRAARAVARDEEAEMGSGDGRAAAAARGVKVGMVARGGGMAEAVAADSGGKRRSSPRFADRPDLNEEIPRGSYVVLPGELPRRKKMAVAKRSKPKVGGFDVQNDINQGSAQSLCPVLKRLEQVYGENQNLKLQLALKTCELEQKENRRLELELDLKAKEIESLQKQNEELKAENEQLRKNTKPPRVKRLCRFCNTHDFHDYRNCPERRRQPASSPEEEDGEDSY